MTTPHLRAAVAAALLTSAVALAGAAPARAAFPGRNGVIVYQTKGSAKGVVYGRPASGGALQRFDARGRVTDPAFSPGGLRLAVSRFGSIATMYTNGSLLRELTVPGGPETEPAWSPAGDQIAFTQGAGDARRIWAIGADGLSLRPITRSGPVDHAPAWSVLNRIAFVRRTAKGHADLFTTDAAGRSSARVTFAPADDEAPAWSPDGRRLAFVRGKGGRGDIYVLDPATRKLKRLTKGLQASSPAWAPDGRRVAFAAQAGRRRQLMDVSSGGGRVRQITRGDSAPAAPDWQPTGGDPVLAAAGDIACDPVSPGFAGGLGTPTLCHERQTSDLLFKADLAGVLVLGDEQYERGTFQAFMASFDPTWGRLRPLLRPVPGNHEYGTPDAAGYFDYFNGPGVANGPAGQRGQGWYSFDVGTWHVVALNSAICVIDAANCAPGSPQESWLRADLAAHPARCTLAYWHHPLFSSSIEGDAPPVRPLWQALQDAHAEVVLSGHAHNYERFAPQNADGLPDTNGLREFIVGTGGKNRQGFKPALAPNSEVRDRRAFGVLGLTLHNGSYDWSFKSAAGTPALNESGSEACH